MSQKWIAAICKSLLKLSFPTCQHSDNWEEETESEESVKSKICENVPLFDITGRRRAQVLESLLSDVTDSPIYASAVSPQEALSKAELRTAQRRLQQKQKWIND